MLTTSNINFPHLPLYLVVMPNLNKRNYAVLNIKKTPLLNLLVQVRKFKVMQVGRIRGCGQCPVFPTALYIPQVPM